MQKKQPQFQSIFSTRTPLTKERVTGLQNIIKAMFLNPLSEQFREPLQWEQRGLINYDFIIERPMDLITVDKLFRKNVYTYTEQCLDDIQLIFQNSFCYNKGTHWIANLTDKCEKAFRKYVKNYLPEIRIKLTFQDKKTLNMNKIEQKKQKVQQIESSHQESLQNSESVNEKEEDADETDTTVPPLNQVAKNSLISKLKEQLFELIQQAKRHSLQVLYLMVKDENMGAISSNINGNCCVDVQKLSVEFIKKAIGFLKSAKQTTKISQVVKVSECKNPQLKRKIKTIVEKNRYEI